MQIAMLLMRQTFVMFVIIAVGALLVRAKLLKVEEGKTISVVTLYVGLPCVIIKAFLTDYSSAARKGVLLALGAAFMIHVLMYLISWILGKIFGLDIMEKSSLIYTNVGNLIIPIIMATIGDRWVVYASAYLCVQSLFFWSFGQRGMHQENSFNWRKMFNSNFVAALIGMALFFTGVPVPKIIYGGLDLVSGIVGPLAMLNIGLICAGMNWKKYFTSARLYRIVFLKMVLCPLIILLILKYSGMQSLAPNGKMVLYAVLLATMTPSAMMIVQLASVCGRDAEYGTSINVATTLVCIITMPLLTMLYMM